MKPCLLRIVAFSSKDYSAEIWMANYIADNAFKCLCNVKENISGTVGPELVAEYMSRQKGWYVYPHDPKFKLGKFEKIYRLTLPGWELQEIEKTKVVEIKIIDAVRVWERGAYKKAD